MEANNFEAQAKNIFDAFLIHPSNKVWNNIETSIQQKKAPIFYWILASFLLISFILSSLILHDLSTNNMFDSKHLGTAINNNNRLQIPISTNKNIATTINNNLKNIHTKKELPHKHLQNTQSIATVTINRASIKKIANKAIKNTIETASSKEAKQINTLPINTVLPSDHVPILNKINDTISAEEKNNIVGTNDILATIEADKKQQPKNTNEVVKQQQKNNKKWAVSLSMQVGASIANKGFFSSTSSADYNGVNTTSGIGSPISTNAFSITLSPALAFSFGVQAQYYLNKKSSIAIGLQYKYASTIIKIKTLANTVSVNTDASVLATNNYQNQFHYIELPFNYCYTIIKNKKEKWQLLMGGQIAQLVQTNARQFNAVQGVFYTDNSLFSKTFMQANLAVYYNIANAKKGAWFIGPAFTYTVNALSNKGLYNQVHQNIIGINIKKYFTKK